MPSVFRINTSLFILQAMRELYLHLHRFTSCQHLHTLLDFYICSVVFLMHLMVMQQGLLNKVFSCYLISFIGISHLRICRRKVSDSRYMHENHHTLVISVNTTGFPFLPSALHNYRYTREAFFAKQFIQVQIFPKLILSLYQSTHDISLCFK